MKTLCTHVIANGNLFKRFAVVAWLMTMLSAMQSFGQAPTISYSGPQTYPEGTAIAPLAPTSSGVAAVAYSSPIIFGYGISWTYGVAVDGEDNVYVVDVNDNTIKMFPAGGGKTVNFASGFKSPAGMAADATGNVYVADMGDNTIREIPAGGGKKTSLGFGFNMPRGVAVGVTGNVYVADYGNNAIKMIPAGGGTPVTLGSGFNKPYGVAVSAAGNIYVADYGNNAIKMIPAGGGTPVTLGTGFNHPGGVAVDRSGNVYVADTYNNAVKEIPAGGGAPVTLGSGFYQPLGVAFDNAGNLYVSDSGGNGITKLFVGDKSAGGFSPPPPINRRVAVDAAGNVYVTDNYASAVKKFPAGGGAPVLIGSGLLYPSGVAVDAAGNVYVADAGHHAVKKIPVGGGATVTLDSGNMQPRGIVTDAAGNVYIADANESAVRKIPVGGGSPVTLGNFPILQCIAADAAGNVYVVYQAHAASFATIKIIPAAGGAPTNLGSFNDRPSGIAVDAGGNIYVADGNLTKIQPGHGSVTLYSTNSALLTGLAVDAKNNIYTVADKINVIDEFKPQGGYYVNPPLPAGLSFDENTGIISGKPTIGSPAANYTVTAFNSKGSTAANVNIKVLPSNDARLFNLQLSTGTLSPFFTSGTSSYTASVPTDTSSVTVTPVTVNPNAKIKVNLEAVASGTASAGIPLAYGPNVISIGVTSEDGTATRTYTVTVTRAALTASNNAHLSALSLTSGKLSPAFATGINNYTASVSNATTSIKVTPVTSEAGATVTVNNQKVLSGNKSQSISLSVGVNRINVEVTAQDGTTTRLYTVMVTRLSSDDNLLNLKFTAGDLYPAFNVNTTDYFVATNYAEISTSVFLVLSNPNATATVNGKPLMSATESPEMPLNIGNNIFTVIVTAQDGITAKTYTVTITRVASSNAGLSYLGVSHCVLSPAFTSAGYNYSASVGDSIHGVVIRPKTSDTTATVTVNGTAVASGSPSTTIPLAVGPNTITIVVTAGDGVTTQTYTLTVTRAPSANANLFKLGPSTGAVTPAFSSSTTSYTLNVNNATASMTLTPVSADTNATIKVNGASVPSGTSSGPIALAPGPNTINTVVTAQDGSTTKTYTLTVTRASGGADSYVPIAIGTGISVTKPTERPTIDYDVIVVHQGVSPNGDGVNDFLVIDGIQAYPDNKLMIMNRNGQLVYEAQGYDNSSKVFDGHSNKNGQMQLPGTYFYQLDYTASGISKHKTGFIVLKY